MKICLIATQLAAGGAERFISVLANEYVNQGHEVHLLVMFKRGIFYKLDPNIKLHEPDFLREDISKFHYFFRLNRYMRKSVKTINPDTIFNIGYISLTIFNLLGLNYPIFISNRSNPLKKRSLPYRIVRRFMYGSATGIIAQTEIAKSHFRKETGNQNIIVIPNFVRNMNQKEAINKKRQIVSVGRFIKSKNFDSLIRIFSGIDRQTWKLILVGDGPESKPLKKLVKDLDIVDSVIFTGYQKNVDKYLEESEIFAFTSLSEGYPNALVEAMATPLACISYDCDAGPRDLINDNQNGFLIPLGDEEVFKGKLTLLMQDDELRNRMSKNAKQIRKTNSLSNTSKLILKFISEY